MTKVVREDGSITSTLGNLSQVFFAASERGDEKLYAEALADLAELWAKADAEQRALINLDFSDLIPTIERES